MPVNEPGNMRPLINKIVNTKYGSVAVPQTTIPKNQCKYTNIIQLSICLLINTKYIQYLVKNDDLSYKLLMISDILLTGRLNTFK